VEGYICKDHETQPNAVLQSAISFQELAPWPDHQTFYAYGWQILAVAITNPVLK
jgi:hypothetical protein